MTNDSLRITAQCKGNDQCLFDGDDMFLVINITNTQQDEIEFPLTYLQKTGPVVKLIDTLSRAERYEQKRKALKLRHKAFPVVRALLTELPSRAAVAARIRADAAFDGPLRQQALIALLQLGRGKNKAR